MDALLAVGRKLLAASLAAGLLCTSWPQAALASSAPKTIGRISAAPGSPRPVAHDALVGLPPSAVAPSVAAAFASPAAEPSAHVQAPILAELGHLSREVAENPSQAPAQLAQLYKEAKAPELPEPSAQPSSSPAERSLGERVRSLFRIRQSVQIDAREVLRENLGGDVGDGILHRDVQRVLKRLTTAARLPAEAAQVFIGNSYLPNAFTMVSPSEHKYLKDNASLAKAFRVSNTFISLGLLRAIENEDQLAFVLAHELVHNHKGHLKDFLGTHVVLGHFHEFEADAGALKLMAKAGYAPQAAVDTLYSLEREMARLQKEYALLGRDRGELAEALHRLSDVHPHNDLRRANMLDHMDEARELQNPGPVSKETPVWMSRRLTGLRPTALDRFDAKLRRTIKIETIEQGLRAVEVFVQAESAKDELSIERWAPIEETYRDLVARTRTAAELRAVELSIYRQRQPRVFPTNRLRGDLTAKQLQFAVAGLPKNATLEDFAQTTVSLSQEAKHAGTLRFLGSISSRRALDAAFRALNNGAESIGLPLEMPDESKLMVARRLWAAAGRALKAELGREARPEEIVDALKAGLSPAWLKGYHDVFSAEIIETAFASQERRSALLPSQLRDRLMALPEGHSAKQLEGLSDNASVESDFWRKRRYHPGGLVKIGNTVAHRYQRYYTRKLTAPSPEDQLDLAVQFMGHNGMIMPEAFIQILRRDGRLDAFVQARLGLASEIVRREWPLSATAQDRERLVRQYSETAERLLQSTLHGLKDLKPIREAVASAWAPTKALARSEAVEGGLTPANRSLLADTFAGAMNAALRTAVVRANTAGRRPDQAELKALRALVRDIEATLRPLSGLDLIKSYARALSKNLGDDKKYMDNHSAALHGMPHERVPGARIHRWLTEDRTAWIAWPAELVWAIWTALYKAGGFNRFSVEGIFEKQRRALSPEIDFAYFLTLAGDDSVEALDKLMAAALLDRLDANGYRAVGMRAAAAVGRWLIEDAVRQASGPSALKQLSGAMLRLNALHPGLLQPDMATFGDPDRAFRPGADYVKRSEPFRSFAKEEHPFRGVNARWAHEMMRKLDEERSWPRKSEEVLDLLDFLNSNGEFSDPIDLRIIKVAEEDPAAFNRWVQKDRARVKTWEGGDKNLEQTAFKSALGDVPNVPVPKAQPLRIVRNPVLRVRLFDLIPESKLGETAPRPSPRQWLNSRLRLYKAYRAARAYFSADFLESLRGEGSMEDKIFTILEEVDRVAEARAQAARRRWDTGEWDKKEDVHMSASTRRKWSGMLPHEQEALVESYKAGQKAALLARLWELYTAYAHTQEPTLGLILDNYPEPTRSRDELLERLIKARSLTPGQLSFLEGNKSYRQPNPLRMLEKQFLDQAVIQLKKFSPEERVDILLHVAGVEALTTEKEKLYNRRVLAGERKKLAREKGAIANISSLQRYMSLLHPKDRGMLMRSLFYGETSLHNEPAQVQRLYEKIVIEGRGLPAYMEKVFRAYFKILTNDEKAKLLSDLAGLENVATGLTGPDILKVALKGMGVTGAKTAQVLATHKGLIPAEYAGPLESFKDRAQDFDKMRVFEVVSERVAALSGKKPELYENAPAKAKLDAWSREALPEVGEAARVRLVRQVDFLLKAQGAKMRWMKTLGRELGSGSIKVVYKVGLDDGRVWIVKVRAPGAAYRTQREFEILDRMIDEMTASGELKTPGARQLLEEVKGLVRAEMDFTDEAAKQTAMRERGRQRPWYTAILAGGVPQISKPHPLYVGEDLMIEEFMPTTRFTDLSAWSLVGPSKRSISRQTIQEGMLDLVVGERLEPDPHTGNRHASRRWHDRLRSRLVVMDVGQEVAMPIARVKPLMRAGLAIETGDLPGAADHILSIVNVPEGVSAADVRAEVIAALERHAGIGLVESLMEALIAAENKTALIKPEYAALEKAFLIYTGYSEWLPKNYIYKALERAAAVRALRDRPAPPLSLAWLQLRRMVFGAASVRPELERLIDRL